jgi:hypothetical protein
MLIGKKQSNNKHICFQVLYHQEIKSSKNIFILFFHSILKIQLLSLFIHCKLVLFNIEKSLHNCFLFLSLITQIASNFGEEFLTTQISIIGCYY